MPTVYDDKELLHEEVRDLKKKIKNIVVAIETDDGFVETMHSNMSAKDLSILVATLEDDLRLKLKYK